MTAIARPSVYPNSVGSVLDTITAETRRVPGTVNIIALSANVAANVPITAGWEWVALNACNSAGTAQIPFFICDAAVATAALPAAISNGTGVEFMPQFYNVRNNSASGLSVISPVAGFLIVSAYTLPQTSVAQ